MNVNLVLAAFLALGLAGPALAQAPAAEAPVRQIASATRIDINQASEKQLDTLPGIGPVRAKAIIAARPYVKPEDLVSRKVLTQKVYDGLKDLISY